jgi:hypothetical protein
LFIKIVDVTPQEFRWIEWNIDSATKHGCTIAEIESIILNPGTGFPRKHRNNTWLVQGRGTGGRMVEVVYVMDDRTIAFVIHAIPLTLRRRRGGR